MFKIDLTQTNDNPKIPRKREDWDRLYYPRKNDRCELSFDPIGNNTDIPIQLFDINDHHLASSKFPHDTTDPNANPFVPYFDNEYE